MNEIKRKNIKKWNGENIKGKKNRKGKRGKAEK